MGRYKDGWVDGWVDGWMERRMDRNTDVPLTTSFSWDRWKLLLFNQILKQSCSAPPAPEPPGCPCCVGSCFVLHPSQTRGRFEPFAAGCTQGPPVTPSVVPGELGMGQGAPRGRAAPGGGGAGRGRWAKSEH